MIVLRPFGFFRLAPGTVGGMLGGPRQGKLAFLGQQLVTTTAGFRSRGRVGGHMGVRRVPFWDGGQGEGGWDRPFPACLYLLARAAGIGVRVHSRNNSGCSGGGSTISSLPAGRDGTGNVRGVAGVRLGGRGRQVGVGCWGQQTLGRGRGRPQETLAAGRGGTGNVRGVAGVRLGGRGRQVGVGCWGQQTLGRGRGRPQETLAAGRGGTGNVRGVAGVRLGGRGRQVGVGCWGRQPLGAGRGRPEETLAAGRGGSGNVRVGVYVSLGGRGGQVGVGCWGRQPLGVGRGRPEETLADGWGGSGIVRGVAGVSLGGRGGQVVVGCVCAACKGLDNCHLHVRVPLVRHSGQVGSCWGQHTLATCRRRVQVTVGVGVGDGCRGGDQGGGGCKGWV